MLLRDGADINGVEGKFPPLKWVAGVGYTSIAQFLLDQGAAIDVVDDTGATSLHEAVDCGHIDVVRLLVARGANVNHINNSGKTALWEASIRGDEASVQLLLENGADPGPICGAGTSPFYRCAELAQDFNVVSEEIRTRYESISRMMREVGVFDPRKNPPLWWAAGEGMEEHIRRCLDDGADIEEKSWKYEDTPLWWAANYGQGAVVRLLLERGANVFWSGVRFYDETPLLKAAVRGDTEVVRLFSESIFDAAVEWYELWPGIVQGRDSTARILLNHGAQVEWTEQDGWKPFSWTCTKAGLMSSWHSWSDLSRS